MLLTELSTINYHCLYNYSRTKFEDTNEIVRSSKSYDRQYNGKRTNYDLVQITQQTKD